MVDLADMEAVLMPVTKPEAEMLATLATAARPHGARRWDAPGVMAALAKVRHLELAEVLMAVGRAARDRDLETPAAIGNLSAVCWIEKPIERTVPVKSTPEQRCGECSQPRDVCERMPRWGDDDHKFRPDFRTGGHSAETAARIREALKVETVTPTGDENEESTR